MRIAMRGHRKPWTSQVGIVGVEVSVGTGVGRPQSRFGPDDGREAPGRGVQFNLASSRSGRVSQSILLLQKNFLCNGRAESLLETLLQRTFALQSYMVTCRGSALDGFDDGDSGLVFAPRGRRETVEGYIKNGTEGSGVCAMPVWTC